MSWKDLREISSLRLASEFKSAANGIDVHAHGACDILLQACDTDASP